MRSATVNSKDSQWGLTLVQIAETLLNSKFFVPCNNLNKIRVGVRPPVISLIIAARVSEDQHFCVLIRQYSRYG